MYNFISKKNIFILSVMVFMFFNFIACKLQYDELNSDANYDKLEDVRDNKGVAKLTSIHNGKIKLRSSNKKIAILNKSYTGSRRQSYPKKIYSISSTKFKNLKGNKNAIKKTGVYLVDSDYVPKSLDKILRKLNLNLDYSGILRNNQGKECSLYIKSYAFKLKPNQTINSKAFPHSFDAGTIEIFYSTITQGNTSLLIGGAIASAWHIYNGTLIPTSIAKIKVDVVVNGFPGSNTEVGCHSAIGTGVDPNWTGIINIIADAELSDGPDDIVTLHQVL